VRGRDDGSHGCSESPVPSPQSLLRLYTRPPTPYFHSVRTLVALALVLAACSTGDRPEDSSASSAPATSSVAGPEPFVLRVPRDGGQARVHHFPALDSVVWSGSSSLPAPAAALSFD